MKQIVELERALSAATHRAEQAEAELAALRVIVGDGWETPDGVEYPVGRVEVLIVRPAVWRDGIEEWEDTRTDRYLSGVIAYRDVRPQEAPAS